MIRQSDIAVRRVVERQPSGRDGAGNGSTGVLEKAGNVAGNSRVATESDAVNVSNPSPKMPVAWVTHESPIPKKVTVHGGSEAELALRHKRFFYAILNFLVSGC